MKFQLYPDAKGEWRWRLVAANGRVVADSGEGYAERSTARDAITRIKRVNQKTEVEVLDSDPRSANEQTQQASTDTAATVADPRNPSPQGAVRG